MNIGILQGRLTKPTRGFQEFPDEWQKEFSYLEFLGLDHIDWLVTKNSFKSNPIVIGEDLTGYPINSICLDNLIDDNFSDPMFLMDQLEPVCINAENNEIGSLTIPLLELSSINDLAARHRFMDSIGQYIEKYSDLIFSFEIESYREAISDVMNLPFDNVRLTYDTGNVTSLGLSHSYYLSMFFDDIDTIHLKDRTFNGKTVFPGRGDTNFYEIFKQLKERGFTKPLTLQADRGVDGYELETTDRHLTFFKQIYGDI